MSVFSISTAIGQVIIPDQEMARFNVYLEAGTIVLISSASANLEVLLGTSGSGIINWYGRAGFGGTGIFYGPVGLGGLAGGTMLIGRDKHHFEVSVGAFVGNDSGVGHTNGNDIFAAPLLDIGYRYQKPGKSFIFRAKGGILGVGIGIGFAF